MDYSIDCIVSLVNEYLENEWSATAEKVVVNGNDYIAYTINSHPFILDPLDIIFKAMEIYESEQEWNKC